MKKPMVIRSTKKEIDKKIEQQMDSLMTVISYFSNSSSKDQDKQKPNYTQKGISSDPISYG